MSLNPYPQYINTPLVWIDKIPDSWKLLRAKNVFDAIDIRSESGLEELLSVSEKSGVTPRRLANVTMFKAESYVGYKLCWSGDLVINSLWAWMQGLGFSTHHGIVSSAYGVYRLKPNYAGEFKYFNFLLRSSPYLWELRVKSKGIWRSRYQLTDESFFTIPIIIPPVQDRKQVVKYLDWKTSQINRFIKAKKQQIELLKEQKQVIINDAVTGKIDVRTGKPYPKYKDTGVEWFGNIPKEWSCQKLKSLGDIRYGLGQPPRSMDKGLPLVRATNISRGKIIRDGILLIDPNDLPKGRDPYLKKGEIIIVRSGAYTGDSAIIPPEFDGAIAGYDMVFSPKDCNSDFISFALLSHYVLKCQIVPASMRAAQPHLNAEELGSILIAIPSSCEEQKVIGEYLHKQLKIVNATLSKVHQEVNLLIEYKTSLICQAVTGKIDITGIKVPEFRADDIFPELEVTSEIEVLQNEATLDNDL